MGNQKGRMEKWSSGNNQGGKMRHGKKKVLKRMKAGGVSKGEGLWENGAMWGVLKKKRKKKKRKTRVFRVGKWKSLKEGTLRRLKIGRRGRRERGTSWRFREKKGKEKQNRRGRRAGERKGS